MAEVICLTTKRKERKIEAFNLLEQSLYLLTYIGAISEHHSVALLAELKVIRGEWPPRQGKIKGGLSVSSHL